MKQNAYARLVWLLAGTFVTVIVLVCPVPVVAADPPPAATQPSKQQVSVGYLRAKLDAKHERLYAQMNKYLIMERQALQDVRAMESEVAKRGGANLGVDGCPRQIELKRWVQEQSELKIQLLKLDTDFDQFTEAKKLGQTPPSIAAAVESNAELRHATAALATAGESSAPEAAAAAKKKLDEVRAAVTGKAMQDYEDDLAWQRKSVNLRLDRIDTAVARLNTELVTIGDLSRTLGLRKADLDAYREQIKMYDKEIGENEADINELAR